MEMVTTAPCHVCDGDGKVEFQIAVDEFIDEDCDMCDGSGELEMDDEDE
jgi:DnaJ-class molecular chaperone